MIKLQMLMDVTQHAMDLSLDGAAPVEIQQQKRFVFPFAATGVKLQERYVMTG